MADTIICHGNNHSQKKYGWVPRREEIDYLILYS